MFYNSTYGIAIFLLFALSSGLSLGLSLYSLLTSGKAYAIAVFALPVFAISLFSLHLMIERKKKEARLREAVLRLLENGALETREGKRTLSVEKMAKTFAIDPRETREILREHQKHRWIPADVRIS
jgi:hypothetical protein